ncbi:Ribosomal protein S18 acetylase RimI [Enhydrobacter aerosaccus]|uniref:Ribosomal protein S18 acetylase RimI n=1 Tax=Enhydrobacter aerosaccus TaxID=225324 RepID=A0A1T4TC85_9HYPH|nr:GNAT family N-acetyltransferase [Enhydrobacter aerosaccus]SKA37941.1 Ribosomal protein S18 acetylase RimI [Enhydrobacter aerosaccus]
MTLTFRTATLAEIDEVWRVVLTAFTPYIHALGRDWPAEDSAAYAEEWARGEAEIGRGDVFVAVEGERIVGVARTRPREKDLYIHQLAVDPSRQGTGVGSWLLQRIDELARARGLDGLSLETAEMAVANIRLYERHGFAIVSRGLPEHGLDAHTRVHMVKTF